MDQPLNFESLTSHTRNTCESIEKYNNNKYINDINESMNMPKQILEMNIVVNESDKIIVEKIKHKMNKVIKSISDILNHIKNHNIKITNEIKTKINKLKDNLIELSILLQNIYKKYNK